MKPNILLAFLCIGLSAYTILKIKDVKPLRTNIVSVVKHD